MWGSGNNGCMLSMCLLNWHIALKVKCVKFGWMIIWICDFYIYKSFYQCIWTTHKYIGFPTYGNVWKYT